MIVDDEDYEKMETFQVCLGEPYVVTADGEEPPPSPGGNTPEEERIRELGRPRLGKLAAGHLPTLNLHLQPSLILASSLRLELFPT